ncbi:MAG: ATP-binding cassette domain-containing protein [Deltaproteobacteria bacterium]|nr:ATP-binding cassette domain-containing protein [Deltaproteobacteria bacterium]MBW2331164.1 ATP-binding cassette domain-containing protein [Deltaproteobacteria bacterium]
MIKVDHLTRLFGDVVAVDDISFEIGKGEIVGLLGHNGAGKTTIMKMLTGFLEPSGGSIAMDGLDMETQRSAIQNRIGYLPENCPLYTEMTVIGYLEYAASLHKIPQSQRSAMIREAITRTELAPKAMERISTLSRGYRQRVGVAQAILHSPKIIIMDEPTNGLDPSQIFQMRTLIKELSRNATVIISTHILQEVQAICDRVIIIRSGKKYLDARLEDLRRANRLLVAVDTAPDQAKPIFDGIEAVADLEVLPKENGRFRYALAVDGDGHAINAAPDVAKAVVDHGARLFSLSQESRDLETIFGEMSAQDGRTAQ